MLCFHRRISYEDDVLGFGLSASYHRGGNDVKDLTVCLDLLSSRAFYDDVVRLGVWNERFTHFLPLIVNTDHARRALPHIEHTLKSIGNWKEFHPKMALLYITKMMNRYGSTGAAQPWRSTPLADSLLVCRLLPALPACAVWWFSS
jgi:hypothetical protein